MENIRQSTGTYILPSYRYVYLVVTSFHLPLPGDWRPEEQYQKTHSITPENKLDRKEQDSKTGTHVRPSYYACHLVATSFHLLPCNLYQVMQGYRASSCKETKKHAMYIQPSPGHAKDGTSRFIVTTRDSTPLRTAERTYLFLSQKVQPFYFFW